MEIKLKTRQIAMISKLVSQMGFKLDFKGKSQDEVGADMLWGIVTNIHKAEKELYVLLSDMTGITVEAIADTEIEELVEEIKEIYKKIAGFFTRPVTSKRI